MGLLYGSSGRAKGLAFLNEAYFGKTKDILALEKQLGKFRKKYLGKPFFENMNTDPESIKFNRMVEDIFGFETFALIVDPNGTFNAFTYPVGNRLDTYEYKSKITADSGGYKYDKNAGFSTTVFIYSALFVDDRFSDAEILAIFLHELGHNFSPAITNSGGFKAIFMKIFVAINLIYSMIMLIFKPIESTRSIMTSFNGLNKIYNQTNDKMKKENPKLLDTVYRIRSFISFINHIINEVFSAFDIITIVGKGVPIGKVIEVFIQRVARLNPITLVHIVFGYEDEKISDNFSAMYGYGNELGSALDKFSKYYGGSTTSETLLSIPIVGHLYNLFTLPIYMLFGLLDPHPEYEARIQNNLDYIRNELKKDNIDPKMRKRLESDLNEMEYQVNETIKTIKIEDTRSPKKIVGYVAYMLFGGDIRNILSFHKQSLKDYDKAYERGMNKVRAVDKVQIK